VQTEKTVYALLMLHCARDTGYAANLVKTILAAKAHYAAVNAYGREELLFAPTQPVAISQTAPPSQRDDPYLDSLMHAASPTEVAQLDEENHPMRYTVVLEREDDGGYVASVPALPGCVSQGDTRSEALNNIREAIELYVEDCRDAGDPVPTEAGKEFVEIEAA